MTTSEILYRDADTSESFWSRSRPGTGDILVLIKYRDFQSRAAHPAIVVMPIVCFCILFDVLLNTVVERKLETLSSWPLENKDSGWLNFSAIQLSSAYSDLRIVRSIVYCFMRLICSLYCQKTYIEDSHPNPLNVFWLGTENWMLLLSILTVHSVICDSQTCSALLYFFWYYPVIVRLRDY